jgi:hypothetical protein
MFRSNSASLGLVFPVCVALATGCTSTHEDLASDDHALTASGSSVPVVSKGSADGHLTVLDVAATTVQALLPPELELSPEQDLSPSGMHPVVVGMWRQSGVVGLAPGSPPPIHYQELAVLIPYVQLKSGVDCVEQRRGPFGYMPYLSLDNQQAIDIGVNFYGYAKHKGTLEAKDGSFVVKSEDGATAFANATFGSATAPSPEMSAPIATLERALQAPLLGKVPKGSFVWSNFDWQFPTATVSASSVDVGFTDASPILAGVQVQHSPSIPGLAMHLDWQLSAPVACGP